MVPDVFLDFIIFEETMLASLEVLAVGTPVIVSKEVDSFLKIQCRNWDDSPSIDDCNSLNKIFLNYESYSEGKNYRRSFPDQKFFSDLKSIIEKISYVKKINKSDFWSWIFCWNPLLNIFLIQTLIRLSLAFMYFYTFYISYTIASSNDNWTLPVFLLES